MAVALTLQHPSASTLDSWQQHSLSAFASNPPLSALRQSSIASIDPSRASSRLAVSAKVPTIHYKTIKSRQPAASPQKSSTNTDTNAVAAARAASLHGKLRKREPSASSTKSSKQPSSSRRSSFGLSRAHTADDSMPFDAFQSNSTSRTIPKDKLRPYLRKLAQKDQGQNQDAIDLSRSVLDNDTLPVFAAYEDSKPASDLTFYPSSPRRHSHRRTYSHTSQNSGLSGSLRQTASFTLGMYSSSRQYSYNNSIIGSESSYDAGQTGGQEEVESLSQPPRLRHQLSQLSQTSDGGIDMPTPLRVNTSGSFRRYAASPSNPSPTPSFGRPRTFTSRSQDTASPTSQLSFDRAFGFIRTKDEPMDPITREASIQAAREAFAEREEAKAEKYAKQERKAAEKRERRKAKQDTQQRRPTEGLQRQMSEAREHDNEDAGQFLAGREYARLPYDRTVSLPLLTNPPASEVSQRKDSVASVRKDAKSRFLQAKAWVKTRTLELGKASKV